MLFLLLTLLTVCHAIHDCLSSTKFLILLIWTWKYYFRSFWYVFVSSLCAFLSFCTLAFVGFLLLHKDTVFTLSHFCLTASVSHGTVFGSWVGWYEFRNCFHLNIDEIFCILHLEYVFQISPEEHQICFLQLLYIIVNSSIGKWGPIVFCGFDCFYFRIRCIFVVTIPCSEDAPSKEE